MCPKHSAFSNSPITRKHKPTDRVNGLANTCRRNVLICRKVSKANGRWAAELRSIFLLNGIPSWTYRQLVSCSLLGCPSAAYIKMVNWRVYTRIIILITNGAFVKYTSRGNAASGDDVRNLTHCLKKGERLCGEGTKGSEGDADSPPNPPVWITASSPPSVSVAVGGNTSRDCWSESGPGISRTPSSARFPWPPKHECPNAEQPPTNSDTHVDFQSYRKRSLIRAVVI